MPQVSNGGDRQISLSSGWSLCARPFSPPSHASTTDGTAHPVRQDRGWDEHRLLDARAGKALHIHAVGWGRGPADVHTMNRPLRRHLPTAVSGRLSRL